MRCRGEPFVRVISTCSSTAATGRGPSSVSTEKFSSGCPKKIGTERPTGLSSGSRALACPHQDLDEIADAEEPAQLVGTGRVTRPAASG